MSKEKSYIKFNFELFTKLTLAVLPFFCLFFSGAYFHTFSAIVKVVPASFFTVEDYLNKSVDYIFPIVMAVYIMGLVILLGLKPLRQKEKEKEGQDFRSPKVQVIAGAAFSFLAAIMLFAQKPPNIHFGIFAILMAFFAPITAIVLKKFGVTGEIENIRSSALSFFVVFITVPAITVMAGSLAQNEVEKAVKMSLKQNHPIILETVSDGFIVVEGGRFSFVNKEMQSLVPSSVLAEGN